MRTATLGAIGVAALVLSGCGGDGSNGSARRQSSVSAVPQLRNIDQLRAAFNAHSGEPQLVVLIAPT